MSTSRYNQLCNEIETFHSLNDTKDRPEKEVYLLCSEMLAKTLPSMSSLNRIRLTFREKDRIIELAYWIFNHLCEEREKVGRKYIFKIKKEKDIQKCVQTLHHFFNFTSQHPKIFDIISDEKLKKMSLTEYIYRFYRYTKRMDLIDSKGFHISSFIEDVNFIPDFKDLMTLITSDCQNGKTFLVMAVSLIYISLGFTPVFIVLSKSQVLQLTFRLKTYIRELKTYLVSLNMFSEEQLDFLSENFLYFDAENKLSDDDDRLSLAINSEKPRFVICIKHYQHLERVNKEITDDSKICLIADEAQVSCCYKDISNIPTYHDDSVKYDKEFITLRQKSTKFIAVSATVQDIIMVEENLYSDNIVFIPQSKNYVGISLWNSNILDISEDKKDNIIPNSALKIITELSKTEPISRNNYRFDKEDKHPIIVLLKTERKKERHLSMLENFIKKRYNNDINNGNWCFIVEHGDGFYIYHHSFPNEPMKIENQLSTIKDREIHYFSSSGKNVVNITDIFQFIAEIGIDTIPRVLLISYDMCKESTSFVSHYDKPNNYHLTHGIFLLNNKISVASLIQTMSRLCGNHGDDIRPTLYTTEKARSNIMNGYLTHKEQIQALMKMSEAGNVNVSQESCKDFLEKHPLFKNRVPTTYNKVKGVKKTLISNPNEENEKEMLKNKKLGIIDYFCEAEPEEYKDEKEMCDLYYYSESDEEEEEDEDNSIPIPKNGTENRKTYSLIVDYLLKNNLKDWVLQSIIKENTKIKGWDYFNNLRISKSELYSLEKKGLFFRKFDNRCYYKYVV